MAKIIRRKENICWAIIIIFTVFIHCFKIGSIPYGIDVDELGMGYDAWCLANFGTDRYLNSFPVYLINYSGGQSALYAYLCAPFVYFFGFSAAVFRIPAVIFSFLTFLFSVKIADKLWHNKKLNLLVGFVYMVSPVFMMLYRIGLDCNLMLGTSAIFIYCLIRAVDSGKIGEFVLAGITGGIVLYSYVISHMVMPVFVVLIWLYLIYVKKINFKQTVALAIPLCILAIPLILMHIINMAGLEEMKVGIFTIPKLYRYRSDDLSYEDIIKNLVNFFKTTLLYDKLKFNSIPQFGNMYIISFPFILLGMLDGIKTLIMSVKERCWNVYVVIVLWFICVYLTGAFIGLDGGPSVYHLNSVFLPYLFFVTYGIAIFYKFILRFGRNIARMCVAVCLTAYVCFFGGFVKYYFFDYTKDTYLLDPFNFMFDDVLEYMQEELPQGVSERTTYIGDGNQTYAYYLGSTYTTPYEYNQLADDEPYTLWQWTLEYKNYRFNFPEEVDPTGNYIVPETSTEYVDLYRQYGLKEEHIGTHYLFWNALLDSERSTAEAIVSWGHGASEGTIVPDSGDETSLSGWAIDLSDGKVWDDIIACVDGEYYVAEKMERQDVVDVLQDDAFLSCGFHINIPTEKILNSNVKVYFINYQNQVSYIEELHG